MQDVNCLLLFQTGPESFTCKMSKALAGRTTVIGAKSWLNTTAERGFRGLFPLQLSAVTLRSASAKGIKFEHKRKKLAPPPQC